MKGKSLGSQTARGVAMLSGATIAGKAVSTLGQIVLALLLLPEEFGLIALAFTVMAFTRAFEQLGLREMLIREQSKLDRWSNSAMWLAAFLGVCGGAVAVCIAPLAGLAFGEPDLFYLILVLAPASPLVSMSQICEAKLERDLRYGQVTVIQFGGLLIQTIIAIACATAGLGALSIVIPKPIIALLRLIYSWRLVQPRVRARPQLHRWRLLLKRGWPITASALLTAGTENADYLILGLIAPTAAVGFYYFAFMQSTQIVWMFCLSLCRVLVPSLSTLKDDPAKQVNAYLRGVGLVGLAIAPLCVMQAALAGPLLRLLFGDKWLESIPLLQLLSLSVLSSVITWPIVSLIMAQGRYGLRLVITGIGLAVFTITITAGALIGDHFGEPTLGAAIAVLCHRMWYGPAQTWYVVRRSGVGISAVARLYLRAILNAAITIGPIWLVSENVLPMLAVEGQWLDAMRTAFVLLAGPITFAVFLRLTQRAAYTELVRRGLGILPTRASRRLPRWLS